MLLPISLPRSCYLSVSILVLLDFGAFKLSLLLLLQAKKMTLKKDV
jgi:hypothetical protein